MANNEMSFECGGEENMKELANSLAQLAAIIMILVTLAISTAAVSQWASAGESVKTQPQTLLAASDK